MSRYSARQKRMRGIGGRSKRQFMRLYTNVKRSKAYHGLSLYGRALLFELLDRYNGINNGMIGLGVREAAYELRCGRTTINRAMREIDDAGLAMPMTVGDLRGKRATEWRLTFLRCDATGELPRSVWEQREPFSLSRYRNTKGPLQGHKAPHCPAPGALGIIDHSSRNKRRKLVRILTMFCLFHKLDDDRMG